MLSPPALNQISAQLLPRLLAVVPLLLGNITHQHVLRFRTYSSTSIQSRYQIVYLYSQMLRLLLVIAIREWTENVSKICRKRYQTQKKFQKFISSPFEAKSKTTFDYFSPEIDRKRAEDIADYIFATGKISKNYSKPLKQIRRLLSTISVQKSIENERKIFLMIYQQQEKIPKNYSKPLKHTERLFLNIALQKWVDIV